MDELIFRPWLAEDEPFLWDMLFRSLHVRDGEPPFPREILDDPEIAHYLRGFGERYGDDAQLCLHRDGRRVGAAWCRRLSSHDPGFGFVDDETPELAMAVDERWRGRGIGRRLLNDLIERNPAMSLSVDDENAGAAGLYHSLGFVDVRTSEGSTTMYRSGT